MAPYAYKNLQDGHIRLITLRPGSSLDDAVVVSITHAPLSRSDTRVKPALRNIQARLSDDWRVHEELSMKLCFCRRQHDGQWETRWRHPDSGLEDDEYETCSHARLPNPLSFEAVSYTWGDPSDRESITVIAPEDHAEEGTLMIGRNLAQALRHLRFEHKPRSLWVDAICINQEDKAERSRQVQRASLVYEEARRVLVWLGPSAQDSDLAISALNEMGKDIIVLENGQILRASENSVQGEAVAGSYERPVWAAIDLLLRRSWFSRIWILQEMLLSDRALIVCGRKEIAREDLGRALWYVKHQPKVEEPLSGALVNRILVLVLPATVTSWTTSSVVAVVHQGHCTIDKDAIYGALGLFPEALRSKISPDYSLPTETVYTSFVRAHIEFSQRVELLRMCDMTQQKRLPGLPSWVPDFYAEPIQLLGTGSWHFSAGHSASDAVFPEPGVLDVSGARVATVLTLSDVVPNHEAEHHVTRSDTIEAILRIRHDFERDEAGMRQREGPEAFMWTLVGRFLAERLPEGLGPGFQAEHLRPMVRASAIFGEGGEIADANSVAASTVDDFCLRMFLGRRVIKTTDGRWCIAPGPAEKGNCLPTLSPFEIRNES